MWSSFPNRPRLARSIGISLLLIVSGNGSALAVATDNTVIGAKAAYATNPTQSNLDALNAAINAVETSGGNQQVGRSVGPDGFGYQGYDSTVDGTPFSFVDITSSGTFVISGDDEGAPVNLNQSFSFYGQALTQVAMATNGYISSDPADAGPDLSNDCPLPAQPSTGGGARIYVLHDDLETASGLTEFFSSCPRPSDTGMNPEPCTVFQWNGTSHYGSSGTPAWDMQAILYHTSGAITYQIGSGNPELGSGSTTGIQDAPPPTTGLTLTCNTDGSIPDNYAATILPPGVTFVPGGSAPVVIGDRSIPTLSEWALIALAIALVTIATIRTRKNSI